MPNDVEIPLRQQRRSVSQLVSYSACSEAFRLERVERAPRRPAAWTIQGTAAHAAIEEWENSGRTTGRKALEDLYLTTYRTEANRLLESNELSVWMTGGFKKAENDLTDREALGWWQVCDYQEYAHSEKDLWEVVASEVEFNIEIATVKVTGFIDQVRRCKVSGRLEPADLKGGAKIPAFPGQLAVYRHAMTLHYPDDTIAEKGYWIHLGKSPTEKVKARHCKAIEVDLSDWPIERMARWLVDMDASEKLGIYLPNPQESCTRVCGVSQWCRAVGAHYPSVQQYEPLNKE